MLDDLVMDAALQGHREIARSRVECQICRTRNASHLPAVVQVVPLTGCSSNLANRHTLDPFRTVHGSNAHALPQAQYAGSIEASSSAVKTLPNAGTSTPTTVKDGNVLFECTVCKRQIASNRYAPHLSSCMGIGTGVRRGTARATNLKTKIPIDSGRSASPYLGSENGNLSDDNSNEKAKGKSKGKIAGICHSLRARCIISLVPCFSTQSRARRPYESGSVLYSWSPIHFSMLQSLQALSSHSKVPSKLRASSTASFLDRERSSTPGSQSSVGTPIGASTSPAISANSPAGTGPPKRGRPKGSKTGVGRGAAALMKRPSPPRPPPPPVRIEPDYLIDVEGEETGSSTDTDGS
ncbi:hypothetical protein JVT61DRAFT_9377 [Boletus reticuloceps]|uniref:SAGA-associated factor 11 n=1 Tax=Boletus reticuloceps TaxID=495285 RepID=A0A8I3A4W5_9AGAM|nr:hypothetical protein JVT61DRAFT_9377 [Boletus reticuloceps]